QPVRLRDVEQQPGCLRDQIRRLEGLDGLVILRHIVMAEPFVGELARAGLIGRPAGRKCKKKQDRRHIPSYFRLRPNGSIGASSSSAPDGRAREGAADLPARSSLTVVVMLAPGGTATVV